MNHTHLVSPEDLKANKPAHIKHIYYCHMDNGMGMWHTNSKSLFLHTHLKRFYALHCAVITHEVRHSRIPQNLVLGFDINTYHHIIIDAQDMFKIHSMPQFWEFVKLTTNYKWWHFFTGYDMILYTVSIMILGVFSQAYGSMVAAAIKLKR